MRLSRFKSISSNNNFSSSLTCDSCRVTLSYQQSQSATESARQLKAGWFIDQNNNIQETQSVIT